MLKFMYKINNFIKTHKAEVVLFCFAFIPRLIFMFLLNNNVGGNFFVDAGTRNTSEYLSIANSIIQGTGFQNFGITSAFRTPIYPLFVAFFLFFHLPLVIVPIIQSMFSVISAILIYRIGGSFFNKRVGLIAGILFAVEPVGILTSSLLMTESLFILLLLLSVHYFQKWYKDGLIKYAILTGFFTGIMTLTRPIPLFVPIVFVAFVLFRGLRTKMIQSVILFLFVFCTIISVWSLRNYIVFGHFKLTNITENEVLYSKILPIAISKEKGIGYYVAYNEVQDNIINLIPDFDPDKYWHAFDYNEILAAEAKNKIFHNLPAVSAYIFWSIIPTGLYNTGYQYVFTSVYPNWDEHQVNLSEFLQKKEYKEFLMAALNPFRALLLVGSLLWVCAYILLIYGIITGLNYKQGLIFCILFSAFFIVIAVAPPLDVRYRLMGLPFIFLLVGLGLNNFFKRINL